MTKVLILGVDGMLGHGVKKAFQNSSLEMYYTSRRNYPHNTNLLKYEAGVDNDSDLSKKLSEIDYVINCIGVIKPEIKNKDSASILNSIKINSLFPHLLNKLAIDNGVKVIQIATDCVYDGLKGGYNENFPHNANDIYGKSKSIGEVRAQNFYNLRVSIVGKEIKGFKSLISWFLKTENKKINGFSNHTWNGITTLAFAKIVYSAIKNNISLPNTLHIIPKDVVSKFELLKYFLKFRFNVDVLKKKSTQQIDRSLKTINKKTLRKLWLHSEYKKIPTIKEIINEI